jgi:hypothetical protein
MPVDINQAKSIFLAALELTGPERTNFLDTQCGTDDELRRRVEAMLAAHANSGELLPRQAFEMLDRADVTDANATSAFDGQSRTPSTEPGVAWPDDLSFLEPANTPGTLGRLGHYEVRQVLGQGGFGVVLKAFDERLHRVVAIKALSTSYAANGAARKRFIREARAAAAIKNEHVVGIYDVQEDAQPPYLVMECIDGIALEDKIQNHGALGVKEVLRIGIQIAEGLAAAHKQGLVHRDIKPANILLENGVERVKLTDFGLARAVDDASVTQSGTVAGTPMYMSPEQAEGLPIDHRSDLFSLGTVLYAMCTGHPPFRASGTHAVLKRVIDASPRPMREVNAEVPDWLEAIVAKLHAKQPEDRFQTAKEVAELLGHRLADVQAGRTNQIEPSRLQNRAEASPAAPAKNQRRVPIGIKVTAASIPLVALVLLGCSLPMIALTILVVALVMARRWFILAGVLLVAVLVGIASSSIGQRLLTIVRGGPELGVLVVQVREPVMRLEIFATGKPDAKRVLADQAATAFSEAFPPGEWNVVAYRRAGEAPFHAKFDLTTAGKTIVIPASDGPPAEQPRAFGGPGWRRLYDGKSYAGWKDFGNSAADSPQFDAHGKRSNSFLLFADSAVETVDTMPRNFHLRMEARLVTGPKLANGEATLRFHAPPREKPQAANDNDGWYLYLVQSNEGKVIAHLEARSSNSRSTGTGATMAKTGEWFYLELISKDDDTELRVNGQNVLNVAGKHGAGVLSLSNTGGGNSQVAFRNIEIKALDEAREPPRPVAAKSLKELEAELEAANAKVKQTQERQALGVASMLDVQDARLKQAETELAWAQVRFKNGPDVDDWHALVTSMHHGRWLFWCVLARSGKATQAEADAVEQALRAAEARRNEARKGWGLAPVAPLLATSTTPRLITAADVGAWTDPKGDCRHEFKAGKLWIRVPAGTHVLAPKYKVNDDYVNAVKGNQDAPRCLQEVEGDFTLQVKLANFPPRDANVRDTTRGAYRGAGLLLWQDRDNFLQLLAKQDGNVTPQFGPPGNQFWCFANGKLAADYRAFGQGMPWLQVQRQGQSLFIRRSNDGVHWEDFTGFNKGFSKWALPKSLQVGLVAVNSSGDTSTLTFEDFKLETDWIPLFNGKDLAGWTPQIERLGDWRVEGNELIGSTAGGPFTHLFTNRSDFTDFHLRAEVKINQIGNSGIFFRASDAEHTPSNMPAGYEAQIFFGDFISGTTRIEPHKTGSLFAKKIVSDPPARANEWFTLEVIAQGKRITIKVNGKTTVNAFDDAAYARGSIALQAIGPETTVRFRKIAIKELPPSEAGWVPLFNGRDLTGWKTHPGQPGNWKVEHGILVGRAPDHASHLFSSRGDFENFHFRVEAKVNDKGDSGQLFRCEYGLNAPQLGGLAPLGYEADIGSTDTSKTGSLVGASWPPVGPKEDLVAPDTWFTQEVIAQGNHIVIKVNGKTTVDFVDPQFRYRRGHLALQAWALGTVVHFNKVEIKELPPSEAAWIPLFNGKDYTGWKQSGKPWPIEGTGEIVADHALHVQTEKPVRADSRLGLEMRLSTGQADIAFNINDRTGWRLNLAESPTKGGGVDATLFSNINGILSKKTGTAKHVANPGQWFRVEIIGGKRTAEVLIEGKKTLELRDDVFPFTPGAVGLTVLPLGPDGPAPSIRFRKIEISEP